MLIAGAVEAHAGAFDAGKVHPGQSGAVNVPFAELASGIEAALEFPCPPDDEPVPDEPTPEEPLPDEPLPLEKPPSGSSEDMPPSLPDDAPLAPEDPLEDPPVPLAPVPPELPHAPTHVAAATTPANSKP